MSTCVGRIGIVGLGLVGQALATRLADAGFDLLGWDHQATARQAWAAQGRPLASSAAIIVCLVVFVGRNRFARPTRLAGASSALFGAAAMLYAADAVPFINRADNIRPLAAAIDAALPPGARLCIFDPEYQPAIFYLHTPYFYANAINELPRDAEYVLVRGGNRRKIESERPEFQMLQDFGGRDKNQLLLLRRRE